VVRRVVEETAEAASFVLDVPSDLEDLFAYEAGQFCTFRVVVDEEPHLRCYSMSSSPEVDDELQVTVKRVPGGIVSNWMLDTLRPGDEVEATAPAGVFCLTEHERDLVAFSGGSGITPVLSLVKTALQTSDRQVHLLYANRDDDSVIFADQLDALVAEHGDRLHVVHRFDVEHGFVDADAVDGLAEATDADVYVCGPTPFMDIVEGALLARSVDPDRIHIERFVAAHEVDDVPEAPPAEAPTGPTQVTIELEGRTDSTEHRPGLTILQTARQLGWTPPFSCESGSCATCMAKLLEGEATMHVNDALTDEEVAEGWVLTCQAVPTSSTVRVRYGFEED
jgi:ferredoxin-NADP reductase